MKTVFKGRYLRLILVASMTVALGPQVGFATEATGLESYVGHERSTTFDTPEAAVEQFKSAVSSDDPSALAKLLGLDAAKLKASEDAMATLRIIKEGSSRRVVLQDMAEGKFLAIGDRLWPLPFPLTKDSAGKWSFDTQRGLQEITNRRVGRNELQTISMMHAYLDAQHQYASEDRDGDGVLEYAQKLISSEGKTDGLYWPPQEGAEPSPVGDFIVDAALRRAEKGLGYFGYRYRILTSQGSNVAGGAYSYIINGNMIAGFGLIASPVQYGETGMQTFMVNHQGVVYQRDFGPDTSNIVDRITQFNPDRFWSVVNE
jgi:hypothetical protein